MARRLQLHEEFCEILGTRNAYFQPPASVKLNYPCIVYSKSGIVKNNANNKLYTNTTRYDGVVICHDPDSNIPDNIVEHFPMCTLGDGYTSDNLNHTPFTLYY